MPFCLGQRCSSLIIPRSKVRFRSRGRIARVVCSPGYQLLGDRFVVCEQGVWLEPLPSCISKLLKKIYWLQTIV